MNKCDQMGDKLRYANIIVSDTGHRIVNPYYWSDSELIEEVASGRKPTALVDFIINTYTNVIFITRTIEDHESYICCTDKTLIDAYIIQKLDYLMQQANRYHIEKMIYLGILLGYYKRDIEIFMDEFINHLNITFDEYWRDCNKQLDCWRLTANTITD